RAGTSSGWLVLPWLLAPPLLLMVASWVDVPGYQQFYSVYCLPALALAAGLGLTRITLPSRATALAPRATVGAPRAIRLALQVIVLVLIAGFGLPSQFAERQPAGH